MKIKKDFVTNSSSISYIFSFPEDEYDGLLDELKELEAHPEAFNEGISIYFEGTTKKELDEYTNGGPLDWAQRPRGPEFEYMSEPAYDAALESLNEGDMVMYLRIDWNVFDQTQEKFGDIIQWEGN